MLRLHSFWRSTASYRVRIALNLKGLDHEIVSYNPVAPAADARDAYRRINPHGLVPTLVDGDLAISQSLAILEYLEETHAAPPLLPRDPADRAFARQIALTVACEIHPLNNVAVLNYLTQDLGLGDEQRRNWYRRWVNRGLDAVESLLRRRGPGGPYCLGATPGFADIFLVPQLFNAHFFDVPTSGWPLLLEIERNCLQLPAFQRARPENQPDAPPP
jgi:maleylacetoacetate isomerase